MPLVLHTEVRTKFPSLWSFSTAEEGFFVVKVSEERRKELEADESTKQLAEQLVDKMLGFTKVQPFTQLFTLFFSPRLLAQSFQTKTKNYFGSTRC